MSTQTPEPGDRLRALGDEVRDEYARNRRVMSFAEYVELVAAQPTQQLRSAPQYVKDTFDYFGSEQVSYPWGQVRRFKLFDCPWAEGRDRLIGQEEVQNRVYRAIAGFVNEGMSNKLILMHGPNGSAKSTLVRCIGRAIQHYSTLPEGACYRINWIFPTQKLSKGIGFGGATPDGTAPGGTYAYLPDDLIDAKLADELRDHPMFMIPAGRRREMIRSLLDAHPDGAQFVPSDYLQYGQLSSKNRAIYEALLASYQGDYVKVLRHVQVERFYIEHRYRTGFVTVEPQMAVDASERQITIDRSLAALPAALQSVSLFEYGGELVGANRGLIEYADLLKRPLEAYKYLLTTVEDSTVSLQAATLFLDVLYIGTSNEIHLTLFKEIPEFQSFKGRLELVRVPYLLDYCQEQRIYEKKLREAAGAKHVAPHCAYVTALWATLTRMRKPLAEKYPKQIADLVARLTPLEKAELYGLGKAPDALTPKQAKELVSHLELLWRESESYPNYEGRTGASPREMQTVLFNAANSTRYGYLSPLGILDEIEELTRNVSVYEFLKQETLPGGFHDNKKFIELTRGRMVDLIDDDVRVSLGLIEEAEYTRLFERYVTHAIHWIKKEKVRNPSTGRLENPDEEMMREVERTLEVAARKDEFRHDLIAKIGAWSLDHPARKPEFIEIFPEHFRKIREAYFGQQRKVVRKGIDDLVAHLHGEPGLAADAQARAERTLAALVERGYNRDSARDAIGVLLKARYND